MSARGRSPGLREASRLHRLGVAENNAGRPARALPLLRRALDAMPAADARPEVAELLARIWISIATSESELGGLAKGLAALTQAQPHVFTAQLPALQAWLDNQLGFMLVRGGKVADGLNHLNAAVDLQGRALEDVSSEFLRSRALVQIP